MDARSRRALIALFTIAFVPCTQCGHTPRPPAVPPVAPVTASLPRRPAYRFLPSMQGTLLDDGRVGILERERLAVGADGAVEQARMTGGGNLLGGMPVPQRLGGGFLFWAVDVVYRSRTFLGPLEAVAPIPTNVISIAFGHDSLFVIELAGERRAYDMDHAKRLPLSPHSAIDVAGADDDRTIALDAVGRPLASTDGGKQWKDVSSQLGAFVTALHGDAKEVWFELANKQGAWLEPDGTLTRRPVPALHPAVDRSQVDAIRFLTRAVESGVVLPGGRALVAFAGGVSVVDLETGKTGDPPREVAPNDFGCEPLSSEDGGLVACFGAKGGGVQVISHVLDPEPRLEKEFPGSPAVSYGAGMLLVEAPCTGGEDRGVVCARHQASWAQHDARATLAGRAVVRWVPKEDGGVAAIFDRKQPPGPIADAALLDVGTGRETAFDQPVEDLRARTATPAPPFGFFNGRNTLTGWIVTRDGVLRGFTRTNSVDVGLDGKVHLGPRTLAQISTYEGMALGRDQGQHLWQTTDYGARWIEVERPPYDASPSSLGKCSQVGCLMSTFANVGSQLRVGWPEDPPRPAVANAGGAAHESDSAADDATRSATHEAAPNIDPPAPPHLPVLECTGRGGAPPKALELTFTAKKDSASNDSPYVEAPHPAAPAPGATAIKPDEAPVLFGGRSLPASHDHAPWASVYYHDRFYGPGTGTGPGWVAQGLRDLVRYEAPNKGRSFSVSSLIGSKKPIEVLYTEDFDPARPVLRAAGSFAQWRDPSGETKPTSATGAGPQDAAARARADQALGHTFGYDGEVRPVLSTRPGHTNGDILIDDSLVFWVGGGKIRPIALGRRTCQPFGGFVDARDKLLLACEDVAGATAIKDAETGETRFRAQPVFPFMGARHESSPSVPPMPREDFDNPDAIAVAKDGSVGLLRLPSGSEPATTDDPAWLLTKDAAPIELAPWSTLQPATSPDCVRGDDGVRALVQTPTAWVNVAGSSGFHIKPGMSALVRWSRERVCLEAIELGYRGVQTPSAPMHMYTEIMVVARFVGRDAGTGLFALSTSTEYHEPVSCKLVTAQGTPATP